MSTTTDRPKLNAKAAQIMAAVHRGYQRGEAMTSEGIAAEILESPGGREAFPDAASTTVSSRANQLVRKGLLAYGTIDRMWSITPDGERLMSTEEPEKPAGKTRGKGGGNGTGDRDRLKAQADRARRAKVEGRPAGTPRPGSMTDAMVKVLERAEEPMGAKDVYAEIKRRRLAPNLKGKTPDATVGAKLATEAKKPHGLFERTAPGKFRLRAMPAAGDGSK